MKKTPSFFNPDFYGFKLVLKSPVAESTYLVSNDDCVKDESGWVTGPNEATIEKRISEYIQTYGKKLRESGLSKEHIKVSVRKYRFKRI